MAYLELVALKYIHIVGAVAWAGGDLFLAFFLLPSVARMRPDARANLAVSLLPKIFQWFFIIGLITIASGVLLAASMGLLTAAAITAPWGLLILIGGLAAVAALLNANLNFKPKGKRLLRIMQTLNAKGASPVSGEAATELTRLFAQIRTGIRINCFLLLFSLFMMTLAGLRML